MRFRGRTRSLLVGGGSTNRYVPPDITDPTTPAGLAVTSYDYNQVSLSWSASTDIGLGVKEYVVYKDDVENQRTSGLTATVTGLTELTTYAFKVSAVDYAGNESDLSSAVNQKTKYNITKAGSFKVGGSEVYYDIADNDVLSAGNSATELTFCWRARPNSVAGTPEDYMINKGGVAGDFEYEFGRVSPNGRIQIVFGLPFGGQFAQWDNGFTAVAWRSIVVVYNGNLADASRVKLYLDGVDEGAPDVKTGTWPTSVPNDTVNLNIGRRPGGGANGTWNGRLTDIQVFQRALSSAEALQYHNRIAISPAPAAWYRFASDDDGDSSSADGDAGGAVNQVIDAIGATTGTIAGTTSGWALVNYP